MAEFVLQANPQVSPKACYFCESFEGPFVNTMRFDPTGRMILICAPNEHNRKTGCAGAITHAIKGLTPQATFELREECKDADRRADEADRRLQELREQVLEKVSA